MTSSGIGVSAALEEAFATAKSEKNVRFIETDIDDESFVATHVEPVGSSTAEEGWNAMVARMQPKHPHIFLARLDEENVGEHGDLGFKWAFVYYVPDGSPVRKRMLFASSRDTAKKQLGEPYFVYDLSGSSADELTWESFVHHAESRNKAASADVMSATEKMLVREAVAEVDMGGSNAHAVRFPASQEAQDAVARVRQEGPELVVLRLDLQAETIELDKVEDVKSADNLQEQVDAAEPRFLIYRWQHEHEGASLTSMVFVYSCPDEAKVKAKMTYSTTKSIAVELAGKVDAKIEINTGDPLNEEIVRTAVHPPPAEPLARNSGVNRPKKPSRGPRRLIK